MQQYGLSYQDEDCKSLSRTLCIVRDWVRTKQAYKITKELAEDLFSMEDMTFPATFYDCRTGRCLWILAT